MTPNEYQLLGKHIAGGAVYISNILLWRESGYFDVSSEVKTLLHLWSLGIEEQFYIIWPFVLLILLKLKFRLDTFILLFIVASCVLNIIMVKTHAIVTFYSPPTRFWKLAIGGGGLACIHYQGSSLWEKVALKTGSVLNVLVYANPHKGNEIKLWRDLLSILGLILIFVSIFTFHTGMHFPGKKALVPTLGAFFLIAAGEYAIVNKRLLSLRIMVFIGLISYPLYLLHCPLLSFARIIYGEIPPRTVIIGLVLLAFLLSWITYRFIEPPLRWGKHSQIKAVCLIITLLCIGCIGLKIYNNNGYITKVENNEYANEIKDIRNLQGKAAITCRNYFPHWGLKDWTDQSCSMQSDDKKIDIAIIGDSFAGHLFAGMAEQASKTNHSISVFPASCNFPYLDLTSRSTEGATYYRAKSHLLHKEAYKFITEHPNIKTVILSHTPGCSYGALYDNSDRSQKDKTVILKNGVRRTFDMLQKYDKNVIIVLSNPPFPKFEACQNRPNFFSHVVKDDNSCTITRHELDSNVARNWYNGIVTEIAKNYSNIFDPAEYLCDNTICLLKRNGHPLYRDGGHLNEEGSRFIAKELIKFIDK